MRYFIYLDRLLSEIFHDFTGVLFLSGWGIFIIGNADEQNRTAVIIQAIGVFFAEYLMNGAVRGFHPF